MGQEATQLPLWLSKYISISKNISMEQINNIGLIHIGLTPVETQISANKPLLFADDIAQDNIPVTSPCIILSMKTLLFP